MLLSTGAVGYPSDSWASCILQTRSSALRWPAQRPTVWIYRWTVRSL